MNTFRPVPLTIVSPSFNQGDYLGEMLQSVVEQRYVPLQHVVIDGGSKDLTVQVLQEFQNVYQLEWISEPDAGIYDALNKALDRARGEWVGWLNCDDLYSPNVLPQISRAILNDPELEVVCGDAEVFQSSDNGDHVTLYIDRHYEGDYFSATRENIRITHLNACFFKKVLLDRVGPFDTSYNIIGDRDYMFRIMKLSPRSCHIRRVVCRYRSHPASLTMAKVNSRSGKPTASQHHPFWAESTRLCDQYLAHKDTPVEIRRWCHRRLAATLVNEAITQLLDRDYTGFAKSIRSATVHHPVSLVRFLPGLVRNMLAKPS